MTKDQDGFGFWRNAKDWLLGVLLLGGIGVVLLLGFIVFGPSPYP